MQSPGALRARALGRFLRGCSESSAFARCAAGALELAAFCRVRANALRQVRTTKEELRAGRRSPLAMRAPGDCNPRPRHHDLQLRSRPIASEACAPRWGRPQASRLAARATHIEAWTLPLSSGEWVHPPAGSQAGTGAVPVGAASEGSPALRPNGARRGGSQYGPPRCTSAQPILQTSRPVGFRRAAAENCRPAIFDARAT